jgi:alpha-galactosidase
VHDLSFRAGTALFGHLGVEWDLAEATPDEIADLTDWITFYKQHRQVLLTGDVVRVDTPDQTAIVHGVVSVDQRQAVFAVASLDTACPDPVGRLRLRGLDPNRSYRVRPVLPGSAPSGMHAPAWWGTSGESRGASDAASADRATRDRLDFPGAIFRGATLQAVGLASARIHPDHVLLYLVEEVLPEPESGSHPGEEAR